MSNRFGSGFPLSALCAAVAIVAAAPAVAQNTTAAVAGQVIGADGKPLAGATVTIVHSDSGSTNTLTTDADGRFSARGLRVGGPYTITAVKGSDREVRNDVYLALAETQSLELRIRGANVLETVVTTGSATGSNKFDSSTMGAGTSIGKQELAAYASISRSLQDYARNDPRVVQTDKGNGEISVAGQNGRFNTVTIDGVKVNDTFGLELNGLPTLKQPISIDAIQAVQVNVSNYDVTQQGYTGANINAVTKSGTNEFTGSVYAAYRDDKLSGDRYDRVRNVTFPTPTFQENLKGFTFGGPIIKDKLFFFANYEELKSSRSVPAFGPLGSSSVNVGITQAQIQAAQDLANSKYGIDIGSLSTPKGVQLVAKDTLLKLDWNVSDNHKVNVRYTKSEESNPIFPNYTANQLSLSSDWYSQVKTLETVVGQWFADWTDSFSTELKLSQRDYKSDPKNNSNLPQVGLTWTTAAPAGTATGNRTLTFGTEQSRHFNSLHTKTFNGFFAGNLFLDKHEIKAGVDLERNEIFNAFLQNTRGVYTFSGTDPIALWNAGVPTSYQVQQPLAGNTLQDGAANWTLSNIGLFVQDTWKVNKQLNIVAGLRLDTLETGDKPKFNSVASGAPTILVNGRAGGGFGYNNSYTLDGQKIIQPRFGFNYQFDTADKLKTQLRGGAGLFMGSAASVWLTNPYQNTGVTTANFSCGGGSTPCSAIQYSPNPATQPTVTGTPPAANVDFIAPGVKQPTVWKMNLALDKELPWYGLVAGAEWLHTEVDKGLYYQYLNLGPVVSTSPLDGREMYYNAAGRSPLCYAGGNDSSPSNCGRLVKSLNNQSFNNVTLLKNTSKGDGDVLTFSLTGPNKTGFGWSAAYTFTRATEVSGLTSSTANSGWLNRAVFNPNEEVAANSATLIRNRFTGNLNWAKAFVGKYRTTFGLFYEGRTGHPYSWTFNNDVNGDGVAGNDLLYIPKGPGSGEVIFRSSNTGAAMTTQAQIDAFTASTSAAAEAKFWSIVDANPSLRNSKGKVVGRNAAFSPFVNSFDVRVSQEVPGLFGNNKGTITLDILNVGNLIKKEWGRIDEVGFGTGGATRRWINYAGIDPTTGKMVYAVNDPSDYTTKQTRGESQWAMQITAKYEF
ncbi:TonB-dependent receptor [Roseateles saccharophilus]|uniref:Carboxypeptidase family protein n=1 Tax=Roseateles saccharophilus TaxID=304 RepID=A0A4R3V645_ROSSA|nr:TonB-dependent receptor [Roseateles saccharophilus]MDG0833747.1 Oar protein [Roseateles saccharophilus]TCU98827.1 carboxypeptidase family protein [Roseateles saccharophilus]